MNSGQNAHILGISLIEAIEQQGFRARFAGGSVRDRLLGRIPHDYDIATDATPEQICSIFTPKTHKVIPTGLDHGTVTVVYRTIPFEITTLRTDVRTDGRHAEVAFGESFEEDAERRDFTVNAMYEDAAGRVYDYFTGREDLAAGKLRFVGEPERRIEEDYLRILRYFRFWAKLGFTPDEKALAAITANKNGLSGISIERITSELTKTIAAQAAGLPALRAMVSTGVLPLLLGHTITEPKLSSSLDRIAELWQQPVATEDAQKMTILAVAILMSPADDEGIDDILTTKLRLPNPSTRLIRHAIALFADQNEEQDTAAAMAFCDACDKAAGQPKAYLPLFQPVLEVMRPGDRERWAKIAKIEEDLSARRLAKLPVTGKDLAKLGIPQDKRCGEILALIKTAYRNGKWTDKADGLALAQKEWEQG